MFSHIRIGVGDYERGFAFYAPLMALLGHELKFAEPENGWAGWKPAAADRPLFLVGHPLEGGHEAGNGQMAAFLAASRTQVDAWYARALELGGTDAGAPGLRPHYHADYYGAYVRDPDGNKLCICCHAPE